MLHSNNVFEFATIEPLHRSSSENELTIEETKDSNDPGLTISGILFLNLFR